MRYFKLLAGIHHQADHEYKFTEKDLKEAEVRGVMPRLPSKRYEPGDIVPSEIDLAEKLGVEKFREVRKVVKRGKPQQNQIPDSPPVDDEPTAHVHEDEDIEEVVHEDEDGEQFVNQPPVAKRELPDLGNMNLQELKEFALAEEVDLAGCTTKKEIAAQIKQTLKGR